MMILKIKYVILTACLFIYMTAGCAVIQGKSTRTYQLEYNAAVQASTDALEDLEIYILDAQVAVSSGSGVDRFLDIEVSDQIHEFIRKQLVKPSEGIKWPE
jgi:hypothetical protein